MIYYLHGLKKYLLFIVFNNLSLFIKQAQLSPLIKEFLFSIIIFGDFLNLEQFEYDSLKEYGKFIVDFKFLCNLI